MEKDITLFSEGMHSTGIEIEHNDAHGDWAVFYQSFPDPWKGHSSERVMVKLEDFDKVIEFLQQAKGALTK